MLGTVALAYILMSSVETTDKRLEVEVPSTAVMDMPGLSAGTSVSKVVVVLADNFPPTQRVEALSLSNDPTTSVSLTSLNVTFDEDIRFEGTCTVDYARTLVDLELGARVQSTRMAASRFTQ